jgi:hypothetical protein
MTFESVQQLAHNLVVSLMQAVAQTPTPSVVSRKPTGVKSILPRPGSVLAIESQESTSIGSTLPDQESGCYPEMEANLAAAPAAPGHYRGSPGTQPSWRQTGARSSSPSVVSIPTRGLSSPGGSVLSELPRKTPGRISPAHGYLEAPPLFPLLWDTKFPSRLPTASMQREAAENRAAYQRSQEAAKVRLTPAAPEDSPPSKDIPPPIPLPRRGRSGVFEVADPAPESLEEELEFKRSDDNPKSGSENLVGGN